MTGATGSTATAGRRYAIRLGLVMAAYVVVLFAALIVLNALPPDSPWRYVVVLAPVVPAAFVPWTVLRLLRETDELQRRIGMESIAAAFALGSLLTFSYGMLQIVGAPALSWLFVWPVYAASWLLTKLLASRRY